MYPRKKFGHSFKIIEALKTIQDIDEKMMQTIPIINVDFI